MMRKRFLFNLNPDVKDVLNDMQRVAKWAAFASGFGGFWPGTEVAWRYSGGALAFE